ncbi:MAG TPA: thioesterase family protein [Pseudomonadales bacterium]
MARIHIELPPQFSFSTEIPVLIQHINAANHLANEQLIALLNEARMRYMRTLPTGQFGIKAGAFINADLAVIYKGEGKYGDVLRIEIAAQDFSHYGCDFVYRVTTVADQRLIAIAKTAMLQFDYNTGKLAAVSADFPALFNA